MVEQLFDNHAVDNEENELMLSLKDYISKKLQDSSVIQDIHYVATMLHPSLKSFNNTISMKYHAEELLKAEFEKYCSSEQQQPQQQQQAASNSNKKNQTKKKQLSISLDDIFDSPMPSNQSQGEQGTKSEFEKYIEDQTRIDKDANMFFIILEKKQISIPDPVSYCLTYSGTTITNRRTRLDTSKVDQLLFIRRNLSALSELFPPAFEQSNKRKNSETSAIPIEKSKNTTDDDSIVVFEDTYDNTHSEEKGKGNVANDQ